jgi:hypothetical protein
LVAVEPTRREKLGGEGVSLHLLDVAPLRRSECAALENLAIHAAAMLEDDVAELMGGSEPLNVEAALGSHHDPAQRNS